MPEDDADARRARAALAAALPPPAIAFVAGPVDVRPSRSGGVAFVPVSRSRGGPAQVVDLSLPPDAPASLAQAVASLRPGDLIAFGPILRRGAGWASDEAWAPRLDPPARDPARAARADAEERDARRRDAAFVAAVRERESLAARLERSLLRSFRALRSRGRGKEEAFAAAVALAARGPGRRVPDLLARAVRAVARSEGPDASDPRVAAALRSVRAPSVGPLPPPARPAAARARPGGPSLGG